MAFRALLICIGLLLLNSGSGANEHIAPAPAETPAAAAEPSPAAEMPERQSRYEVRIVIDTSGSMKQTDPKNLRTPALKLLVNLLPEGTEAGVWTFDIAPRELMPVAAVNGDWKSAAAQSAARIDSKGAFTNIEKALSAVAADWLSNPDPENRRRLVLLTDGMVDVSKDPQESTVSREAILNRLIPALQQAGVEVHAIALSSQADDDLLRQLALSTKGWNAVAQDAEQLQRTFLQIFNQSIPHGSVPIKDNRFTLDGSVEEFTLLALLQPGAQPTRLTSPDGQTISQTGLPENVLWLHDPTFDLVTVSRPAPGEWRLEADQDPANQVMVVSDLKMEPFKIPSYLDAGEKPPIGALFTDRGEPITREDFLSLLSVKAELKDAAGKRDFMLMHEPGQAGTFSADAGEPLTPGEYTLVITADGKTFQRESQQIFRVLADLLRVETRADESMNPPGLTITLTPNPQNLATDSLTIRATLTDQADQSHELNAERVDDSWQIRLPAPGQGDRWIVTFDAKGTSPDGQPVEIPLKPLTFAANPRPAAPAHPEPPASTLPSEVPSNPPNWPMAIAITVVINIVLLLTAYGISRLLRKRRETAIAQLLAKFSS